MRGRGEKEKGKIKLRGGGVNSLRLLTCTLKQELLAEKVSN